MKKLCFSTFAKVLMRCKPHRVKQKWLCGTVLLSIAPEFYDIRDNDGTTSGLVRGKDSISETVTENITTVNLSAVAKYFSDVVVPLLDPNKSSLIILALKDIIRYDESIEPITVVEIINRYTKADISIQTSFVFADFLAGVFLYIVANTDNRGSEDYVNDITDEYIQSFEPYKTNITFLDAYSSVNRATVADIAATASEIALLTETSGECQRCGRPLGIVRDDGPVSYAKLVRVQDDIDVIVCVDCEREMHNLSDVDKNLLISQKQSLYRLVEARDSISKHTLEGEILEVLSAIDEMDITDETKLKIEPVRVEKKITEKRLKDHVLSDVTKLYEGVNNALDSLSGENRLNVDNFAKSIRRMFEDANDKLISQSDIYYSLVEALFRTCGRKHKTACEVVISYFVQRCEVFNEIT